MLLGLLNFHMSLITLGHHLVEFFPECFVLSFHGFRDTSGIGLKSLQIRCLRVEHLQQFLVLLQRLPCIIILRFEGVTLPFGLLPAELVLHELGLAVCELLTCIFQKLVRLHLVLFHARDDVLHRVHLRIHLFQLTVLGLRVLFAYGGTS